LSSSCQRSAPETNAGQECSKETLCAALL
jgi:hypothetical protein